jgi:hemerythrin superfamily protein
VNKFKFKILNKSTGEIIYINKHLFINKLNNNIIKWNNKYKYYTIKNNKI